MVALCVCDALCLLVGVIGKLRASEVEVEGGAPVPAPALFTSSTVPLTDRGRNQWSFGRGTGVDSLAVLAQSAAGPACVEVFCSVLVEVVCDVPLAPRKARTRLQYDGKVDRVVYS